MSPSLPALHGRYCLISNHSLWAAAVWNGRWVLLCFIYPSFFLSCSCSGVGVAFPICSFSQTHRTSRALFWDALLQDLFLKHNNYSHLAQSPAVIYAAFCDHCAKALKLLSHITPAMLSFLRTFWQGGERDKNSKLIQIKVPQPSQIWGRLKCRWFLKEAIWD